MAAALGSMAGSMVAPVVERASEDPLGFVINILLEWGTGLLIVGSILGAVGFMGQTWAQKELNQSGQSAANMVNVFNNLSNPATPLTQANYQSVTTPNPLQDAMNAAANAWTAVSGAAQAVGGTITDVWTAIQDAYRLVVNVVTQGPGVALHLLGGIIVDGLSMVLIFVFPYLIILGSVLVALGAILYFVRVAWARVMEPVVSEWWDAKVLLPFQAQLRGALSLSSKAAPAAAEAPPAAPSPPVAPLPVPVPPEAPARAYVEERRHEGASPGAESHPETVIGVEEPIHMDSIGTLPAISTEEQEASLGDGLTEAKDRLRAALRARDGLSPSPARPKRRARPRDLVAWAYGQIPREVSA